MTTHAMEPRSVLSHPATIRPQTLSQTWPWKTRQPKGLWKNKFGPFLCLVWMALVIPPIPAADTNLPPPRPVTLEACFRMALEENLDLRIERVNPAILALSVELARDAYDPSFVISADHSEADQGRFN